MASHHSDIQLFGVAAAAAAAAMYADAASRRLRLRCARPGAIFLETHTQRKQTDTHTHCEDGLLYLGWTT